jgi:Flp pilus assembly protein TadG
VSLRRTPGRREGGQALVEFALALPLFAMFVFCVIELSLVLVSYYSETRMARESARWLAVNGSNSDDQVAAHVQNTMLPGLIAGTPSVISDDNVTAVYQVGKMRVQFTACGAATPPCTNALRAPGTTLYVEMNYDVANLLFLPTNFRMGSLQTSLPTVLPAYRVWVMNE